MGTLDSRISRRALLRRGGAAAAGFGLATVGLDRRPAIGWAARRPASMPEPDRAALLLSRAAFGPRVGDVERVRKIGGEAWVEEQLAWQGIDDGEVDQLLAEAYPTLAMTGPQLLALYQDSPNLAADHLIGATVYRQLFSRRQLHEVMVDFWSDHFSINIRDTFSRIWKTLDDRDVVRAHALGNFKDLLTASAKSAAMSSYLNNDENRKGRPNENYAREIMELHTLGVAVSGVPYNEQDVKEVARCFTGWSWSRLDNGTAGAFLFTLGQHDQGAKTVLGQPIAANGGLQDGQRVIEILVNHEATARFLATKLVRRFVTDDPATFAPDLVAAVADTYRRTGGDIAAMVRLILTSQAFYASFRTGGGRFSRPLDLTVRALRAANLEATDLRVPNAWNTFSRMVLSRSGYLTSMGHVPFTWLTPDGFPDTKEPWSSSAVNLARWNFGLQLAQGQVVPGFRPATQRPAAVQTPEGVVDFWVERLLHRAVDPADRATLVAFFAVNGAMPPAAQVASREAQLIALILDSPYFQWR